MVDPQRFPVRVRQVTVEAERIRSYELVDPNGAALPPFTAGAHIDVVIARHPRLFEEPSCEVLLVDACELCDHSL